MPTARELRDQIAALQVELQTKLDEEKAFVIADIKRQMAAFEISAEALLGKVSKKHKAVPPRFKDPNSGNTWSGRGKPPRWIAGKDREQFRIHPA